MIEKIKTAFWFAGRPTHWAQALALAERKFKPNLDTDAHRAEATAWARERAVPVEDALRIIGLDGQAPTIDPALLADGEKRAATSKVVMGGPGDLSLLHSVVALSGAKKVIETGVAYGWSSLAILSAFKDKEGRLASVDMPYPKMGNEAFVGIVVPEELRAQWTLVREPDRNGLKKALAALGGTVDLVHYDSDKSYWGRQFAFDLLWDALPTGGIFISDDIQDNMGFAEFALKKGCPFAVTESSDKFVGIILKNGA